MDPARLVGGGGGGGLLLNFGHGSGCDHWQKKVITGGLMAPRSIQKALKVFNHLQVVQDHP